MIRRDVIYNSPGLLNSCFTFSLQSKPLQPWLPYGTQVIMLLDYSYLGYWIFERHGIAL